MQILAAAKAKPDRKAVKKPAFATGILNIQEVADFAGQENKPKHAM